jgi:hypothetical protein
LNFDDESRSPGRLFHACARCARLGDCTELSETFLLPGRLKHVACVWCNSMPFFLLNVAASVFKRSSSQGQQTGGSATVTNRRIIHDKYEFLKNGKPPCIKGSLTTALLKNRPPHFSVILLLVTQQLTDISLKYQIPG